MVDFLQMVLSGIAVGSSYALMGLGMVLIYKTSEVPNFVQGEMALCRFSSPTCCFPLMAFPTTSLFPLP